MRRGTTSPPAVSRLAGPPPAALRAAASLVVAGLLMLVFAAPALADHTIDFRIVGFGDQDCTSGSTRLVTSTAEPFRVEVCVALDGSPLAGHEMTVVVTHGDGTVEEMPITSGPDGRVTVQIVPVAAGTTTVEVCDADGCDYGSVEMSADNAPRPEPVASYGGPTSDVGITEPIADGEDDFTDPYTADTAAPGSGEPAIDLASIRYLGVRDGKARFEFTTRGDACSVFTDGAPFLQLSVFVETPDGASYLAGYRRSETGPVQTAVTSEGARLEGTTVELEDWIDPSTGVLAVGGVDVPPGSTVRLETWLSVDPLSSGFYDTAEGTALPAATTPEPAATTVTTGATTATTAPSAATTVAATATTLPGGGNTTGGSFRIWIPIVILGLAVGGFWVYYRTRERGAQPPPPTGGDDDDDDGDDPGDTPPPAAYGEHIEHTGCGWALYVTNEWGVPLLIRSPGGVVHECCRYYVHVKTSANSAMAARSRRDTAPDRLRMHDAGRDITDLRIEARSGARSGPAGRQDWMHGLGNPRDQSDVEAGQFHQRQPNEDPADVAAHLEHWERTTLAITLVSECPQYTSRHALEGASDLTVMTTHECTNDAGDPCPVELTAAGRMRGAIEGPGRFKTEVLHEPGTTPDDLDRDPSSTDDLGGYGQRAGHDHAEKDRVTHEFSADDRSSEVADADHLNIVVRNQIVLDAAQIVPEEVWPTTERVTAHVETMITHEVTVTTKLTTIGCDTNGCCGHGTCDCNAEFEVSLSRFGSSLVVEGEAWELRRDPAPIGVDEWKTWALRKL